MKEKIKFVNEQGEIFFECTEVEARKAMNSVQEFRKKEDTGKETQRLKQEFDDLLKSVPPVPPEEEIRLAQDGLEIPDFSNMFAAMENQNYLVTHIFMNAFRYADLRKLDGTVVETETKMWKLAAGWMATLWGAKIVVRELISKNEVFIVSSRKVSMNFRPDFAIRRTFKFDGKPVEKKSNIEERLEAIEKMLKTLMEVKPTEVMTVG